MKKKPVADESTRIGESAGLGGIVGGIEGGLFHGKPSLGGAAMGALKGAGLYGTAQGLGDLVLGKPEEEGHFGDEALRGLVGGAMVGAPLGIMKTGMAPKGMLLVKYLMQKGLSKEAAAAAVLGGGGAIGAGIHGLDKGLMLGFEHDPEKREDY